MAGLTSTAATQIERFGQRAVITRQGEKVCVTDTVGAELQPSVEIIARVLIEEQEATREGGTIKALVGITPEYTPEIDDVLTAVTSAFSFTINAIRPQYFGETLIYNEIDGSY